jgi:hypothetical protein
MHPVRLNALFVVSIPLCGCTTAVEEVYDPPPAEVNVSDPGAPRDPPADELKELTTLADVVVRCRVLQRRAAPEGVNYTLEVQEVLSARGEGANIGVGDVLRVSAFLYREGRPLARIGELAELNRYLFFLSPMEEKGWWLHLDDASGYMLPDAEESLRTLRLLRSDASPNR